MEMNMEESRKLYEKWAIEVMQFTPDDLVWDERRNCYRYYVPHMAWKGWQASRAAIEIRVPVKDFNNPSLSDGNGLSFSEAMDVFDAIRAAGIKVKE